MPKEFKTEIPTANTAFVITFPEAQAAKITKAVCNWASAEVSAASMKKVISENFRGIVISQLRQEAAVETPAAE